MGRFAYIPLSFENINNGLERELSIDYDNNDLYVIDDYKVPISATKFIREDIEFIEESIDDNLDKSNNNVEKINDFYNSFNILESKTINQINYLKELFSKIDQLEDVAGVDYLLPASEELLEKAENIYNKLEEIFVNYSGGIVGKINEMNSKYEKALTLYNTYNRYLNNYKNVVNTMTAEINTMKNGLSSKLSALGNGNGSFTYNYVKTSGGTEVKTYTASGYFRWMGNNPYTYTKGSWYKNPYKPDSFMGIGSWANANKKDPNNPSLTYFQSLNMKVTAPSKYTTNKGKYNWWYNQGSTALKKLITTCVWVKGNSAAPTKSTVTSTTPALNKYYKKVKVVYTKKVTENTTTNSIVTKSFSLPVIT